MFFYRKPIFKNWVSNKKSIFHPFGLNFLQKITSDSDSSSKNTSVWVNPKFEKSGVCSDLFWLSWKTKKSIFYIFFGFFTTFKINHYKNHFFGISGWPILTYFLTRNPNLTLFLAKNWPQKGVKSIFCWKLNFQKLALL